MGQEFQNASTSIYSLMVVMNTEAEIYGLGYEQGIDRVLLRGLKDTVSLFLKMPSKLVGV